MKRVPLPALGRRQGELWQGWYEKKALWLMRAQCRHDTVPTLVCFLGSYQHNFSLDPHAQPFSR